MKINSHVVVGIIIIMFGILGCISVYLLNYDYYKNFVHFVKSDCFIESIDLEKYTTTVTYEVNGEKFTKKLNIYDSSYKVGTKADIYYDSSDPIKSYLQCEVTFFKMLIILGYIIIVTGIYIILNYFVKQHHYSKLKNKGKRIKATIASIEPKKFLSLFPLHPSLICATANIKGSQYNFLSETIYSKSIKYLEKKKIKNIDIYINENEIADYYVDISFIDTKM